MTKPPDPWPSKSRVNKAGTRIRRILREPEKYMGSEISDLTGSTPLERYLEDCNIVLAHRDSHARPMASACNSLRNSCKVLGISDAKVTQRLKRFPTILEKLQYEPNLAPGRMHDIGGVRAVVPTLAEVRRLQERLLRTHPDAIVKDYVDTPRPSGYRAVHVIAFWGRNPRRQIEIQLRSLRMHEWADMVETASRQLGIEAKHDGDSPFHRWAAMESRVMAAFELGLPISKEVEVGYSEAYDGFFGTQGEESDV